MRCHPATWFWGAFILLDIALVVWGVSWTLDHEQGAASCSEACAPYASRYDGDCECQSPDLRWGAGT